MATLALMLGAAAVPVMRVLGGGGGRIQNVGLLTAQTASTDGYNYFLVTVGGSGAPRPQSQSFDPILWQQGWPRNAYLTNLDALEAKGLVVSVYTQPDGIIRARLVDESQAARQAQVALMRQAMNTPAPPQLVKELAANPGIHSTTWLTPGLVSVQTHHSAAWVSRLPGVTSVSSDPAITVQSTPNNWGFMDQWDLKNTGQYTPGIPGAGTPGDDTNVLSAWSNTMGQGVTVAVLDMGVVQPLQGLAQVTSTNLQQAPNYNFVTNEPGAVADTSMCGSGALSVGYCEALHGTWVTGVIDAATNSGSALAGIAPGANMLEEVVGTNGSVNVGEAVSAIYYALDHGAKVLNLSWGGTGDFPGISSLEAAIQQANVDGALVVVAAGNSGQNNNPTSPDPASNSNPYTMYPASLAEPNIISVGASTPTDTKAPFSNYGNNSVSLFAPGDQLLTTSYDQMSAYVSGTSLAAPVVSAAAALVWSVHPTWTPEQVKADLMNTVTPSSALSGYAEAPGVINIGNAVAAAEQGAMTTTFSGFNTLSAGTKGSTSVQITDPAAASATGSLDLRLSLAVDIDNQIDAAGGIPVSYTEGSTTGTATTDAAGVLTIPAPTNLSSGTSIQLGLDLPWSGEWGLAVSVVPASDPTTTNTLGARAVYFNVAGNAPAPTPVAPGQPSSGPSGTSTGNTPSSSTGSAGGTSTSPTPTPSSGTSTTTPSSGSETIPASPSGSSGSSNTPTSPSGSTSNTSSPSTGSGGTGGQQLRVTPPSQEIPPSSPTSSPTPVPDPTPVGNTNPSSGSAPATGTSSNPSGSTGSTPSPSTGSGGTSTRSTPTGIFGLESVQPNVVSTSGGDQVTIYGTAIPSGAHVLIGGQPATVVYDGAPTTLTVITPPAAAGPMDVKVIAPDGTSQTMTGALTYKVLSSGGSTPSNGTGSSGTSSGTSTGGSTPSSGTGTTNGTGSGSTSSSTSTPSSGTVTSPSGSTPSSGTGTTNGTGSGSTSSGTSTSGGTPSSGTSTGGSGATTSPGSVSNPTTPTVDYNSTPSTPTVYTMPSSNQADSDLAGSYPSMWSMFSTAGSSSSGYAV